MAKSKLITADASLIFGVLNQEIEAMQVCAAGATATLELFDGALGTIATSAIGAAGTGYEVGDTITLVQAGGGVQAVFTVATVGGSGEVTGLTLVSGGTGYVAGATYATTTDSVAGADLTVTASTVTDAGTSFGKVSCAANTCSNPFKFGHRGVLITNGLSARIIGSGAKGYIVHK